MLAYMRPFLLTVNCALNCFYHPLRSNIVRHDYHENNPISFARCDILRMCSQRSMLQAQMPRKIVFLANLPGITL